MNFEELGLRIAAAPSRAHRARPYPKSDYLEGAWKFLSDLWAWAHGVGSSHFDATWPQLQAKGKFEDGAQVERSLRRYKAILEEIGLAKIYGVKDANGAWQRLDVELLEPPPFEPDPALVSRLSRRSSSVGSSDCLSGRSRGRRWELQPLTRKVRRRLQGMPRSGRAGRRAYPRILLCRSGNLPGPQRGGHQQVDDLSPATGPERAHAHEPGPLDGRREPAARPAAPATPVGVPGPAAPSSGDGGAIRRAALTGETARSKSGGVPAARLARIAMQHGPQAAVKLAVDARLAGDDAAVWIAALWWVLRPGEPPANAQRLEQLRRGAAMVERYAGFGAGDQAAAVRLAGERIAAEAHEDGEPRLRSLAGVAAWLYATGRRWRRDARARAGEVEPRKVDGKPLLRPRHSGWTWPDWW